MKAIDKLIRLLCIVSMSIMVSACQNEFDSGIVPLMETSSPTSTNVGPVSMQATSTLYLTGNSPERNGTCQEIDQISNPIAGLNGTLLFGKKTIFDEDRFNQIFAIHLPDLSEETFLVADSRTNYSYPKISPNGKYLAILRATGLVDTDAIEIYSSSGDLLTSVPWDKGNWTSYYGWTENDHLVIEQFTGNKLLILDPFSQARDVVSLDDEHSLRLRGFDPPAKIFALGYKNSIDPREIDTTILWGSDTNQTVHKFDNQAQKPSELRWSHRGDLIATTNRNQIFLLDDQGNDIEKFDFSKNNILIWGIEWSSNDEQIFFWGWDRGLSDTRDVTQTYSNTGDFLYKINIADKEIESYCLTSKIFESDYSDFRNKNYLVPISTKYFVTENYTEYNSSTDLYRYDILLVDTQNNKALKLGENYDLIGWMPDKP